jgi:membrane protease YdiL (CAAX protease family)
MAKKPASVLPYVLPFALFLFLLAAEGYCPDQHYVVSPIRALLVAGAILWGWRELPSLRPSAFFASVLVGIVGVVLWVALDPWALRLDALLEGIFNRAIHASGLTSWQMTLTPLHPVGRDPFRLYSPALAWFLFILRVAGISLVVPVMEELFWRGFLMRWIIRDDFTEVPLGTYRADSFWGTTAAFTLVHGSEWPLAVVVGTLYGAWFVRQKSLGDVMMAHGVTNFLLALYCLFSGDWHFLSTVTAK